jgi:hypothetical protein
MCMLRSGRVAAPSLHTCFPSFDMVWKDVTGSMAQEPSGGYRLADRIG